VPCNIKEQLVKSDTLHNIRENLRKNIAA